MVIPEGRIEWDLRTVVLSYFVAFAVTFVACILMFHMHYHLGRQIASSTIAAAGVCAMHYTGKPFPALPLSFCGSFDQLDFLVRWTTLTIFIS